MIRQVKFLFLMRASEYIMLDKEEKEEYISNYSSLQIDDPLYKTSDIWKDLGITDFLTVSEFVKARGRRILKKAHIYCYHRIRSRDRINIGLRYGIMSAELELKLGDDSMWRINKVFR